MIICTAALYYCYLWLFESREIICFFHDTMQIPLMMT